MSAAVAAIDSSVVSAAAKDVIPEGYRVLQEGKGRVLYEGDGAVFYNPVQEFNRDLSICVIDQFAQLRQEEIRAGRLQKLRRRLVSLENLEKGIAAGRAVRGPDSELTPEARATRIEELRAKVQQQEQAVTNNAEPEDVDKLRVLEALSATGLRSMRYWAELGPNRLQTLVVNDLLDGAVTAIRRNIAFNGLPEDRVIASHGDANMVMHQARAAHKPFSVIDLDPYGTAVPFLDAAVQAIEDGGLLLVTCTDKAVLCGSNPEKCFSMYRSVSLKGDFCHEQAVRIVLQSIDSAASRAGRYIEPLLCLSIDFYVRLFVRVRVGQQEAKLAASKHSRMYSCTQCHTTELEPVGRAAPRQTRKQKEEAKVAASASTFASSATVSTSQMEADNDSEDQDVDHEMEDSKDQEDLENAASAEHGKRRGNPPVSPEELLNLVRRQQIRFSAGAGPMVPQNCPHCDSRWMVGGPIWSDPLHNMAFVDRLLAAVEANPTRWGTHKRMLGQLTMVKAELQDVPLVWSLSRLASFVRTNTPRQAEFRSALLHLGYRQSASHTGPGLFKTDAPPEVVWELARQWLLRTLPEPAGAEQLGPAETRQNKIDMFLARRTEVKRPLNAREDYSVAHTPLGRMLVKPPPSPAILANWSLHPDYQEPDVAAFPPNPEKNWGPKARAKGQVRDAQVVADKIKMKRQDRKRKRMNSQACHFLAVDKACNNSGECLYSHDPVVLQEYRQRFEATREANMARKKAKQAAFQQQTDSQP